MVPVLFTIFNYPVSSFGVFLILGFLVGIFLIWRLSRAWDLDEEKILDLTLLTFLGGLFGARIYFVLEHVSIFATNLTRIILINKFPGFSFWGGFLGGWLTLFFLAKNKKEDFWMLSDIAVVGFLGSLIFSDIGCFLGGCNVGVKTDLFLSIPMVGLVGRRFPVQILEALLFSGVLSNIWSQAIRFHPRGKIVSLSLIYIGIIKFFIEPLKQNHDEGKFLSLVLFFLGVTIYYRVMRRNLILDIKNLGLSFSKIIINSTFRKLAFDRFRKYWYNQTTLFFWNIKNFKKIIRRFNVRFSFKNH